MLDTKLLDANKHADVQVAGSLLHDGRLVAVPTETVYGLAADASSVDAVKRIYAAKQRPHDHPLIVHIGSIEEMEKWASDIPANAITLARHYWPGPLTLLLTKAPGVNTVVTGGKDTIALRMPAHPVLLGLLQQTGLAIAAPSANLYGQLSPTTAAQVMATMAGKIDAVLDGGQCEIGLESTIIDPGSQPLSILRNGPITASQINEACDLDVINPVKHSIAVPGNVEAHYQPRARLLLVSKDELFDMLQEATTETACLFHSTELGMPESPVVRKMPIEKAAYARQLYKTLFEIDTPAITTILVEIPPDEEEWSDVNERLLKAAANSPG